uniref:Uncharacterized protein n=1 Tax=Sander lucioperca TaxID=283035 RepID=A0A8D0D024_SANLU
MKAQTDGAALVIQQTTKPVRWLGRSNGNTGERRRSTTRRCRWSLSANLPFERLRRADWPYRFHRRKRAGLAVLVLGVFQKRSIFHLPRRASSGYFSSEGDSLPSSPLSLRPVTADRATQTPSPTGQVMNHALQRMAGATRQRNAAGDMQAEAIGRELRRIGDDFNRLFLLRHRGGKAAPFSSARPSVNSQQWERHKNKT